MLLAVLFPAGMPSGVQRVGVLAPLSPEQGRHSVGDFRAGMRAPGWTEGGNVAIEDRYANGDRALAAANAAAFVAEKVDVIVAISWTAMADRQWSTP
jgi:putative ABC transport system substrate-binding protein